MRCARILAFIPALLTALGDFTAAADSFVDEGYVVQQWQTQEGLPQNSVNSIVQTSDGYLWLGTFNGLVRFDGVQFTTYNVANTPELRSDLIHILGVGTDGRLWIGTGLGLVWRQDGRFVVPPPSAGFEALDIRFILRSPTDETWLGTWDAVFRFSGEKLIPVGRLPAHAVPIQRMGFDLNGELILGTAVGLWRALPEGLARIDPATMVPEADAIDAYFDMRRDLWRGRDGARLPARVMRHEARSMTSFDGPRLWLLRDEALHLIEGDRAVSFGGNPVLSRHDINCFLPEDGGGLWVGMDGGGLVRLRPKKLRTISTAQGLPSENTVTLAEDDGGHVWIGRLGIKRGLSRIDPTGASLITDVGDFAHHSVSCCYRSRDGTIWIGTIEAGLFSWRDGVLEQRREGPLPHLPERGTLIRVMFEDRAGGFWIGSDLGLDHIRDGRRVRYTTEDGLSHNTVTSVVQDSGGTIWAGTVDGLNRFTADGRIERFGTKQGLGANIVHALFVDREGTLWVGTAGGGLSRFDGSRFLTLSTRQGLVNDVVAQIIDDEEGALWIGTNRGISRLSKAELQEFAEGKRRFVSSISLGRHHGMVNEECGGGFQPACMRDRHGHLWFSTIGGPVIVDPAKVGASALSPIVHIESVVADDQAVAVRRSDVAPEKFEAVIPAGCQMMTLSYTGIDFEAAEELLFQYRLDGYDTSWREAGTRRVAYYTRVPPGTYRFEVKSVSPGGSWSKEPAVLELKILPFWWQTNAFRAACVLAIAAAIGGVIRWANQRLVRYRATRLAFSRRLIESQESERRRIASELHDSLGQSLMVIKNRADLALRDGGLTSNGQEHVREIATVSSDAAQEVRQISHALRPAQLDRLGLTRTLETMATRMARSGDLELKMTVQDVNDLLPESAQIHLLRIAQEILHNALKHARASRLEFSLTNEGQSACLRVADDGRGFSGTADHESSRTGIGLMAIRERVEILGGSLRIDTRPGAGTEIEVWVPRAQRLSTHEFNGKN